MEEVYKWKSEIETPDTMIMTPVTPFSSLIKLLSTSKQVRFRP